MDNDTLRRMANQIADFYGPYSDEEAVDGIAVHIAKFWEPRMREALQAAFSDTPDIFKPRVAKAIERLKA
ncbi:MAG: formate dehydrogenase subunit delta [Maricaulis sp.]|mgnify:CR=1 FL=1|jgi:formate dehydrogenase subunit delta|nr:formate dehydrogenase subunit delta [Maricaulis sp.]MDG2043712.1 formate dehydrogenase subunit delta [Maricaulis sp.]